MKCSGIWETFNQPEPNWGLLHLTPLREAGEAGR